MVGFNKHYPSFSWSSESSDHFPPLSWLPSSVQGSPSLSRLSNWKSFALIWYFIEHMKPIRISHRKMVNELLGLSILEFKLCTETFSYHRHYSKNNSLTSVSYTFIFALLPCDLTRSKIQDILEPQSDTGWKGPQEVSAHSSLSQKGQVFPGIF